MVYKLFFDTQDIVNSIETVEKVNLTKIRKGVKDMIDYEARTQKRLAQQEELALQREKLALQEGKQKGILETAQNLVESLKNEHKEASYDTIIKKAASLLGLDQPMVERLKSIYIK